MKVKLCRWPVDVATSLGELFAVRNQRIVGCGWTRLGSLMRFAVLIEKEAANAGIAITLAVSGKGVAGAVGCGGNIFQLVGTFVLDVGIAGGSVRWRQT